MSKSEEWVKRGAVPTMRSLNAPLEIMKLKGSFDLLVPLPERCVEYGTFIGWRSSFLG